MKTPEIYCVLDSSAIVWDKEKFDTNPAPYYALTVSLMSFFEILGRERPKILLRADMISELVNGFPAASVTGIPNFKELSFAVYSFLGTQAENIIQFDHNTNGLIISSPNITYAYYSDILQNETRRLTSYIHLNSQGILFLTFSQTWPAEVKLKTLLPPDSVPHETIRINDSELTVFFQNRKPVFEHNPKHDRIRGYRIENNEEIFPLSCYDGHDAIYIQYLLDTAIPADPNSEKLYNWDGTTYVCFHNHLNNKYHAFDQPSEKVPLSIKQKLLKS